MWASISIRTCSYEMSRARFMARNCSNSLGSRDSSAAVLMSASRAAVVVPLDLLLSYRRTSSSCRVLREDLAVYTDLESQNCSALFTTQRIPTTDQMSLMVLLQQRCRSLCFLLRLRVHHGLVRSFRTCCSSA